MLYSAITFMQCVTVQTAASLQAGAQSPSSSTACFLLRDVVGAQKTFQEDHKRGKSGDCDLPALLLSPTAPPTLEIVPSTRIKEQRDRFRRTAVTTATSTKPERKKKKKEPTQLKAGDAAHFSLK